MITYAEYTDIGKREKNEDSIASLCMENGGLFVLADGLGGHGRGEYASGSVVRTSMQLYHDNPEGFQLANCFDRCQEILMREQKEKPELADMKTTMVALQVSDGIAKWAHVGDSRLYCFKKRKQKELLTTAFLRCLWQWARLRKKISDFMRTETDCSELWEQNGRIEAILSLPN